MPPEVRSYRLSYGDDGEPLGLIPAYVDEEATGIGYLRFSYHRGRVLVEYECDDPAFSAAFYADEIAEKAKECLNA